MKFALLLFIAFFGHHLFAQTTPDSTQAVITDTSTVADTAKVHSIKLAAIFSAVIPGAGQVYNHIAMPKGQKKAFWKVPLIYAGLGVTTYFALKNNSEQRAIKTEFRFRESTGFENDPDYFNYDSQGFLTLYNQKSNRRDLFFMGLGLVYLIQVADAAVEAHFVKFDVSEDLTMSIRPTILPSNQLGIALSFKFR